MNESSFCGDLGCFTAGTEGIGSQGNLPRVRPNRLSNPL